MFFGDASAKCFSTLAFLLFTLEPLFSPDQLFDQTHMSTISPGHCVVCGQETWLRCSACSTHSLDWMFFCSREHQALVSLSLDRSRALLLTSVLRTGLVHAQEDLWNQGSTFSISRFYSHRNQRHGRSIKQAVQATWRYRAIDVLRFALGWL